MEIIEIEKLEKRREALFKAIPRTKKTQGGITIYKLDQTCDEWTELQDINKTLKADFGYFMHKTLTDNYKTIPNEAELLTK